MERVLRLSPPLLLLLLLLCGAVVRSDEAVDCGEPPRLENGIHIGNDYSFRQWVHYRCNKGYELFGSSRILCTHVGWSKFNIRCQIIQCGRPQPVANGAVWPRGEGTYGQQADYSCDRGYTLTGERTITCTDTGHWSHPAPNCTVIRCDCPQPVANGTVWPRGEGTYGQQADYSCDQGYTLTGERTITCTDTGHWSHPAPNCTVIRCDPPQPVADGTVWPRGEGTYGQQADYSCDQGYTLTGERTINCTDTGHWSHPAPNCTAVNCGEPPRLENGIHIGDDYSRPRSNKGYERFGSSRIRRTDEGWTKRNTRCLKNIGNQSGRKTNTIAGYKAATIGGGSIGAVAAVVVAAALVTAGLVALGVYINNRKTRSYSFGKRFKVGEEPSISNDSSVTTPPQTYISPPLTTK
ncbi:P-selectin-like [Leucoraja erinacea]|uniref:P-selectin-like n=1 Tax=Leucoraja erinaceus TaxID=7782 RepID=UPI002456214F|nr:P-selectin-like [Leucoraja erinacea]